MGPNGPSPGTAVLSPGGDAITVTWLDGSSEIFNACWLRHNCRCPECREPSSGQKIIQIAAITGSAAKEVRVDRDRANIHDPAHAAELRERLGEGEMVVRVLWVHAGTEHWSSYTRTALYPNAVPPTAPATTKTSVPELAFGKVITSLDVQWQWLNHLRESGACLIRGAPTRAGVVIELAGW
jgi:gamma-butyrobetaine dioxygenase